MKPNTNPHDIHPEIVNIVSTFQLNTEIDLEKLASKIEDCSYNPETFASVTIKLEKPKTSAKIFKSGKVVLTGCRSVEDGTKASKKITQIVRKVGFKVKNTNFNVQNIVANYDFKFPIELKSLYDSQSDYSQYEPEVFPGLTYRMEKPKITFTIFSTGKVVATGAKDRESLDEAFNKIYKIILINGNVKKQNHK